MDHPTANSESECPPGFEALPVYASGQEIAGASPKGVLGANGIRAFRHVASAVRVVIFAAPGPLVSATIFVGTEPVSKAGHPHTLEHIIFLGSKKYPHRGYLDNLACRSISNGTNAWTSTEHTAYVVKTAGLDGFLNLLPCYLDHIMRPNINRAAFDSEVYHVLEDGKEAGVVFCEIQGRENTEEDLSSYAMEEILFEGTPLALPEGGLCNDIRTLTNEQIVQYHRDQYCGANVSVVVGGSGIPSHALLSSVKSLLDEISSAPGYKPGVPRWQVPLQFKPLPPVTRKVIPFPSSEESIGTVILGWRGPRGSERMDVAVIDVLLRYLSEDVWSPLRQRFVDGEDQFASSVAPSLETFFDVGSFSLSFYGVDHLDEDDDEEDSDDDNDDDGDDDDDDDDHNDDGNEPGEHTNGESGAHDDEEEEESFLLSSKLEKMVMMYLSEICESGKLPGGLSAMLIAIKKEREYRLTQLESNSHSTVPDDLLEELVYGNRGTLLIGDEARGFLKYYKAMEQKDEAFWISALQRFFVEAPRVELVMVPDAELAQQLAREEKQALDDRLSHYGTEALSRIGRENKERIASLKTIKFKADLFPPIPSPTTISRFPYAVSRDKRAYYTQQYVAVETDFVHCSILIDSKRLTLEQRMLLSVLCDLIPTCDIRNDDGSLTSYTDHARALSEATISDHHSAVHIGCHGEMVHQCVVVQFAAAPESFAEAARLMLLSLFQSEVSPERIASISQTLIASYTSRMRDAEEMLVAQSTIIPYLECGDGCEGDLPNFVLSNFVALFPLVAFLSEEFASRKARRDDVRENVVHKLQDVLTTVRGLRSDDVFVQITAREPEKAGDMLASMWAEKGDRRSMANGPGGARDDEMRVVGKIDGKGAELPISRRICKLVDEMVRGQSVGKVCGIGGVESSFAHVIVDSAVCVGHADWAALSVFMEMVCRVEGPLSDSVRVSGLAYGAEIENSSWTGQLSLYIHDSSALASAWDAACTCLETFRKRLEMVDEREGGQQDGQQGGQEGGEDSEDVAVLRAELDTAKASKLYSMSESRSCPDMIAWGAIARTGLGVPASPMADQALEEEVERVSLRCLKRVFDTHVRKIYDGECGRMISIVCGQEAVEKTIEEFAQCKWPLALDECGVESMFPKQVQRFVKSLKS